MSARELRSRHKTSQEKDEVSKPEESRQEETTTITEEVSPENKTIQETQQGQEKSEQDSIKGLKEIAIVEMADFEVVDVGDKLNLLMSAINKINTTFHYKFEELQKQITSDVLPKVKEIERVNQELVAWVDDLEANIIKNDALMDRLDLLENASASMKGDISLLKGLMQVQDKQVSHNKEKIVDLMARSMANNIVITGLVEKKEEDCRETVLYFLRNVMKMRVDTEEVLVAHRLGKPQTATNAKPRQMVVRCGQFLRDRIFKFTVNLKGVKNDMGDYFFVDQQLPEPLYTLKKEREMKVKKVKKKNADIPEDQKELKIHVLIKNKTLIIDNVPQKQHVKPPTAADILNVSKEDRIKMGSLELFESSTIQEKGSVFRGFAVPIKSSSDIRLAYRKMKMLYPESDHIVLAYKVKNYTGHHDHGEYGVGRKLSDVLGSRKNTALLVTREFGGIHLGQRRFLYIEKVAKEALNNMDTSH